jgi:hypothetical protein
MKNFIVVTRVSIDDFNIFKIWHEYYSRVFQHFGCCILKRPNDDIRNIIDFCKLNNINFNILEQSYFSNESTFDKVKEIIDQKEYEYILSLDSDEFISDLTFFSVIDLSKYDCYSLLMNDRISENGKLYDISNCAFYEDLLKVAPISSEITKTIQNWENRKCCILKYPDLGLLHFPSPGKNCCYTNLVRLEHFKWRKEWLPKAKRRYCELIEQKIPWSEGLFKAIEYIESVENEKAR